MCDERVYSAHTHHFPEREADRIEQKTRKKRFQGVKKEKERKCIEIVKTRILCVSISFFGTVKTSF